jgi:hypothetical protein
MPVFKLDLIFEAKGRGWEETYYRDFPNPDFGAAFTVANTLAQKRIVLSAAPVFIKAYRLQDPLTEGRQGSVFYYNPIITPGTSGGPQGAASPDTAINTTWINNATNKDRTLQMRGIWDAAVTNFNELNTPEYAAWNALFLTYRTYCLQTGFGWLTRNSVARNVPVSYALTDPILPIFTFPAGTFAVPGDVGKFKLIRFSRFNGSKSELNRELVVQVLTATTAQAAAPIAVGPMINPGRAIIYGTPTFTVANQIGVTRVGRRAPGAPLLYTPGRRRARPRT